MHLSPKELGSFVKKFIDKYSLILGPDFHHVSYNYTINYQETKIIFTSNDTKVTFAISNSNGATYVNFDIESLDGHYIEESFVNSVLNIEKIDYSMINDMVQSLVENDKEYIQSIEKHSLSEDFISSTHVTVQSFKYIVNIMYIPVFFKIIKSKRMSFEIKHNLKLDEDLNFYFDFTVYVNHMGKSINSIDVYSKHKFYSRTKNIDNAMKNMTYDIELLINELFHERCESIKQKVSKKINMAFDFEFGTHFKDELKIIEMLLI